MASFKIEYGKSLVNFDIQADGQIKCPFCDKYYTRIIGHLNQSSCKKGDTRNLKLTLDKFLQELFREKVKKDQRNRKRSSDSYLRAVDNEKFKQNQRERKARSDDNGRLIDNEKFK